MATKLLACFIACIVLAIIIAIVGVVFIMRGKKANDASMQKRAIIYFPVAIILLCVGIYVGQFYFSNKAALETTNTGTTTTAPATTGTDTGTTNSTTNGTTNSTTNGASTTAPTTTTTP